MGISLFGIGYTTGVSGVGLREIESNKTISKQSLFSEVSNTSLSQEGKVPPSGTTDPNVLANAPSSLISIAGKSTSAKYVVNLSANTLYRYDAKGNPIAAYLIASGKKSTPTTPGVKMISHIETFPYKNAPRNSKRRRHPRDYGPKILILRKVNSQTGETSETGEFIHGNNNYDSLGKYASHGCMRMDNDVIQELAADSKHGDYVLVLK